METLKNEMKLEFLSKSANEAFARVAVSAFASQLDPTIEELADIKTSVSEAVTNSIVHAYSGKDGVIKIHSKLYENCIEIEVLDTGCGIENIEEAKTPLFTTKSSLERSGMGFTIMENFMDELKVESVVGLGTKVYMKKNISNNRRVAMMNYKSLASNDCNNENKLFEKNAGLIWCVVKKFCNSGYDLDDLYQIGSIGFLKATRRFKAEYGYQLSTFAVPYISGEIKKFIRDDGMIKISRSLKKNCKITIESMNEIFTENGKEEKIDRLVCKEDEQNKIIDKMTINDLVEKLSCRDKTIIKLRYFKEKTQEQVAEKLGISQVQVCRIEKRILNNLRANL